MDEEKDLFIVTEKLRLDKLLAKAYPALSRSYFQMLFDNKAITYQGNPVKKREELPIGAEISISFIETETIKAEPEAIALDVLFEDEHIIAINKPAPMVVHPAPGHPSGTFVNALLHHCQLDPLLKEETLRPGIVHRLDKDTSGVLVAAKTRQAHQALIDLFKERNIEKTYICVALDKVEDQTISNFIKRHHKNRQKMTCSESEGKEAITTFSLLQFERPFSLVSCKLHTGRTHQIRVHLSSIGHPIVGDSLYGSATINKSYSAPRQLLHAYSLAFTHPITKKALSITAKLPSDMQTWMEKHHLTLPSL